MGAMSGKMATVHAKPPPEYKLPGYTGYTPQAKYCFEQRYSSVVDAAHAGITGGAGYRLMDPNKH